MTVLELHSHTDSTVRWTEICPAEHRASMHRVDHGVNANPAADPRTRGRGVTRPGARPVGRHDAAAPRRGAPADRRPALAPTASRMPTPRLADRTRPVSADQVRACRIEAPAPACVVDDVPAWALLACGIVFGVIMLLAVAFLGGPAYA
ncbi:MULTISPECIES: hypothetical protein [Dietzia]|uniref:hypothetical protein n=1 Tax=Dietzia TaxID=37914 RepID=UPI00101AD565|nr:MULTISPECIES: hypothetical protein [Dietzia]MCT2262997.1 hypothetical protein [Dietzia cinnamea]MCT2273715.1 hypothetical protein [Dietzia cinnamea]